MMDIVLHRRTQRHRHRRGPRNPAALERQHLRHPAAHPERCQQHQDPPLPAPRDERALSDPRPRHPLHRAPPSVRGGWRARQRIVCRQGQGTTGVRRLVALAAFASDARHGSCCGLPCGWCCSSRHAILDSDGRSKRTVHYRWIPGVMVMRCMITELVGCLFG